MSLATADKGELKTGKNLDHMIWFQIWIQRKWRVETRVLEIVEGFRKGMLEQCFAIHRTHHFGASS
jgi:hypothetical protein